MIAALVAMPGMRLLHTKYPDPTSKTLAALHISWFRFFNSTADALTTAAAAHASPCLPCNSTLRSNELLLVFLPALLLLLLRRINPPVVILRIRIAGVGRILYTKLRSMTRMHRREPFS